MILTNIKDCSSCTHSKVYGSSELKEVTCESSDYIHQKLFKADGRKCASVCDGYCERPKTSGNRDGLIEQDKALEFMLAGKCECVLHSTKTNEDFRFEIIKRQTEKDKNKFIYFLNYCLGHDKNYAGVVWFDDKTDEFRFSQGAKGQMTGNEIPIRSLIFVLNKLLREEHVNNLLVYHVGKCGRCGKKLTTPESILTGLGPTCCKHLGIPRIKELK